MTMSVFVLSACSGSKAVEPVVDCEDIDDSSRRELLGEYADATMPAESLYTGREHQYVKEAVNQLEEIATVEWRIISAGFGVVRPDTELPSYECTFSDVDSVRDRAERMGHGPDELTKAERIRVVADGLGIPADVEHYLAERFDLVFIALGENYLFATGSALELIPEETTAFAFAAEGTRELVGECQWVPSTGRERAALSTTWIAVKGHQLRCLATQLTTTQALSDLQTGETVRDVSIQCSGT